MSPGQAVMELGAELEPGCLYRIILCLSRTICHRTVRKMLLSGPEWLCQPFLLGPSGPWEVEMAIVTLGEGMSLGRSSWIIQE
jgi:hypothetical protein